MKITVTMDLTPSEMKLLVQNSIERVMNNAITVGELAQEHLPTELEKERGSILWQDCEELKPVTVKIWHAVTNRLFEEKLV